MLKSRVVMVLAAMLISLGLKAEDPVKNKLDALKSRGLDFSDAAFFLPFANDKGWFPYMESKVVGERWKNKERPVAFFFNAKWEKNSRLKDQYCLYFDGKNLSGNSGGGRLFQHEDSHTIAAWVAFEDPIGAYMIFCEGHGGIGGRSLSLSWGYAEHVVQAVKSERKGAAINFVPKALEWIQMAGVYDREKKIVQLYINGKLVKEASADIPPINVDASGFYIGSNKVGGPAFKGWMDELLVYNRALQPEELEKLYIRGLPDKDCEFVSAPPKLKPGEKEFSDKPSLEDLWFYADYDKKVSPVYSCGEAGSLETSSKFGTGGPVFGKGKFRDAILIRSGEDSNLADTLSYGMKIPREQFTASFWFKPEISKWNTGKPIWGRTFFSSFFGNPSMSYGGSIQAKAGVYPKINLAENGKNATKFTEDKWTHIALVSSVDGKTIIYVDGNPTASADLPYSRDFGNELFIGSDWNRKSDKGLRIDGWIDDFVFMKKALSEEAVKRLATSGKPAIEEMKGVGFASARTVFKRGENISYPLRLPFKGKVTAALCQEGNPAAKPVSIFSGEAANLSWDLPLNTLLFRPGDYQLTVSVSNGKDTEERGLKAMRIVSSQEPAIPFGIYCTTHSVEEMPDYLEKWRDTGINYTHIGGPGIAYSRLSLIDSLYRHKIDWVPNIITSHLTEAEKAGLKHEDYAQLEIGSEKLSDNNSLFSSLVQEKLNARIKGIVSQCSGHPGFKYISLWDEYDSKHDVSPGALRYFKEKTGIDKLPSFEARPKGTVVPDNDPYARWIDTFGVGMWTNKGLGYHDALMTKFAQSVKPEIKSMSTPNGGYGGTSISMPEAYCYLAESDHRRDIGASELLVEASMESYRCTDMNHPRRPVWPLLGWWSTPSLPGFNESIKVMTEIAFAKGAQGLIYAGDTWIYRDDMAASVKKLSGFRDTYGAFLKQFTYEGIGNVALLWNDYEMLGEKNPAGRPSFAPDTRLAAAFRLAGIPFEYVHTDQVLNGELKRFDAILLPRYNYATESLKKNLDAFAAAGGVIFAAKDNSALAPESAVTYEPKDYDYRSTKPNDEAHGKMENVQSLAPKIRELVLPKLKSQRPVYADNNYLASYYAPGPNCEIYFIINTDLYLAQAGMVHFSKPLSNAYSLLERGSLGKSGTELNVKLEKGEWQVIVNYHNPINSLKVKSTLEACKLNYTVSILSGNSTLNSAVPLQIRFFDPAGQERPDYTQNIVSGPNGQASGSFTFASANDPKGEWRMETSIPFAGLKNEAKFIIK